MQHLSESVFVEMCHIVGFSHMVIMRREMADIMDVILNQVTTTKRVTMMTSGSYREGFRLEGSDVDVMLWPNDHTVIWDLDMAQNYDLYRNTLILCDCSDSQPGFALLELLTPTHQESVKNACMRINKRLYISSSKYRQIKCSVSIPTFKEHGPCGSGVIMGAEYDHAQCFVSDFWPPPASKWIDRCHSWPPSYVVEDIVRNGCHFVAIGHKLGKHADKEWRISFSLADQKLIYSINHCQFLTYGMLKLFLKECINKELREEDKCLCSYHMKTAVFWAIQQNTVSHWHPQNILECFWICFKIILKWVYEGVCPNFFIPENNMFLSNIHGEAQTNLFLTLHKFFEKGLVSLIQIQCSMPSGLQNEHILISKVLFEIDLFDELYGRSLPTIDLNKCMRFFNAVEKLIFSPLSQYQILMLQKLAVTILQKTAYMLYNLTVFAPFKGYTSSIVNKQVYLAYKASSHMLKLAAKFGCISDLLYIAMFNYKILRYNEALSVIEMAKVKLAQPYVMYILNKDINAKMYILRETIWRQSWSTKMKHAVAYDIEFENAIFYINELVPEQQSGSRCKQSELLIPLYVFIHMLEILCYRHGDPVSAGTVLNVLQNLVHNDQGVSTHAYHRDISWQVLGICQQVTGNYQSALYSYEQSFRQETQNYIQIAALMRIIDALVKLREMLFEILTL
ncbi:uncharacterized protein LOC134240631 [Saccostrea cucullata]|uniref:uncharacterized protein LOC134240631 n=1 Tax=Saccostrea cuccullata TaxID=36930 RepID=UPI002ED1D848